mmetsp:Transcript_30512/g.88025  ORF Transcript_30512/g.88025 Transcript_30512/m.88025 type:complete len:236 (-) Transcript_30512:237-944(-)
MADAPCAAPHEVAEGQRMSPMHLSSIGWCSVWQRDVPRDRAIGQSEAARGPPHIAHECREQQRGAPDAFPAEAAAARGEGRPFSPTCSDGPATSLCSTTGSSPAARLSPRPAEAPARPPPARPPPAPRIPERIPKSRRVRCSREPAAKDDQGAEEESDFECGSSICSSASSGSTSPGPQKAAGHEPPFGFLIGLGARAGTRSPDESSCCRSSMRRGAMDVSSASSAIKCHPEVGC